MIRKISFSKRKLLKFIGFSSFLPLQTEAKEKIPLAPCSFPFDASREGVFIRKIFNVNKERNYRIVLYFYHNGGEKADELYEILSADEALFTTESVRLGHPIKVTSDDFIEKKFYYSIQEKNQALTKSSNKYWAAVHEAISAKFEKTESIFMWLPQNLKGLIPVTLELTKISGGDNSIEVISRETINANGWDYAGGGCFEVPITSHILSTGTYEIQAETVKDSPLFFDVKVELAINYREKV